MYLKIFSRSSIGGMTLFSFEGTFPTGGGICFFRRWRFPFACNSVHLSIDPILGLRSNFSREKFKGKYEAEKLDLIPFEDIIIRLLFLKKTYDRPGRLVHIPLLG
jgi:hypothetical protein